jgi:energy-coupling factor transport system permease protein
MTSRQLRNLDPRAWLAWSLAASVPPLVGRNPWPLLVVLVAVAGTRIAWADAMVRAGGWSLFVRLAMIFAAVSIVFNVLTVRAGDLEIARLPDWLPLIGGELTVNAALYGILSGFALVLLVIIGSTVGTLLDWPAVTRLTPAGLTSIAVAGSIALAFVPQATVAFREIREAQAARGHRFRGARDLLPVVVPTLGGGLERAITLAESLESRGFGGIARSCVSARPWAPFAGAGSLGAFAVAAYAVAVERLALAAIAAAVALLLGLASLRLGPRPTIARTRYRMRPWASGDSAVTIGAGIALLASVVTLQISPDAFRYEPYPHIGVPAISLPLLIGLLGLLAPVLVAPPVRAPA